MKIKFNGHACFTITSDSGIKIVTDPYEPGGFGGTIKYSAVPDQADIVIVTHEHGDHNFVKQLKGSPVVVKTSQEVKGIKFNAIPVFHDAGEGKERGKNTIFVFDVDGVRIAHLGDLGHLLDQNHKKQIGDIDVLLIPVGGFFTIDADKAAEVVDTLKPRIAIPMHFKTPKADFPIASADNFVKKFAKVKEVNATEIELIKSGLPKTTEVWVLRYAC